MSNSDPKGQNASDPNRSRAIPDAAEIGQLLNRRYRTMEVLGSGTFGPTYLAADTHRPGSPHCVVKQLCPMANGLESLRTARRLFQKEAEVLERLGKHDRIPQLLAYFEEAQQLYLVKEFIPGTPLSEEIMPGSPLKWETVFDLLHSVLEILVFVHGQGVIHRDIKPANLIRRQEDGALVLIDFGSVKEIGNQLAGERTRTIAAGTPVYMPVEQFQGNPKFNSDLYALGTIAIQALTGLSPESLPKLQDPEGHLRWQDRCQVNQQLADLIDKMVKYSSAQRYHSAEEVLADLRKIEVRSTSQKASSVKTAPPKSLVFAKTLQAQAVKAVKPSSWQSNGRLLAMGAGVLVSMGVIAWLWSGKRPIFGNAETFYQRGAQKIASGDGKGALAEFDAAIAIAPQDAMAYYKRGNAYFDLGNLEAAIADYTQALELDPTHGDFYYNRGLARSKLNKLQGAIEDYNQALDRHPDDAEAFYQRALAAYDLGDYQAAINDYTQAILLEPSNSQAYQSRGLAYSALGEKQKAMADYTQAIQVNSNDPAAYYNRGRARYALGDYPGALEDYTKALQLDPKQVSAYTNRCSVQLNLGKYDEAISDCTKALELRPKEWMAYSNRCVAHYNLKQYPSAIDDCTDAIDLNSNHAKAYSNRGLARAASGETSKAIADYTQAISLNPNDAVAYSNRGMAHADLDDYTKAIEDHTQAIRLNPDLGAAYYNRGLVRQQLNDRSGAIDDFQRAATTCLDQGLVNCYNNTQFQIEQMR